MGAWNRFANHFRPSFSLDELFHRFDCLWARIVVHLVVIGREEFEKRKALDLVILADLIGCSPLAVHRSDVRCVIDVFV